MRLTMTMKIEKNNDKMLTYHPISMVENIITTHPYTPLKMLTLIHTCNGFFQLLRGIHFHKN